MTTADDASRLPDPLARSATRVLVVGAGPIGLETAIELRRRGIDTLNVDQGPLGAQERYHQGHSSFHLVA
ncbi:MAG: hypothetical protein GWP75_13695, partial [Planctomycetia bacterium]|nr:hypothetical protein [Planctomycetia bacterium]